MATTKRKYSTKKLSTAAGTPRFPSLPLVIPNDTTYNPETNELLPIPSAFYTHAILYLYSHFTNNTIAQYILFADIILLLSFI